MSSVLKNAARKFALKHAPPEIVVLLKSSLANYRSIGGKPFPHKNVYVTETVPGGTVLFLSPHPDDEAIGMGGAMSMHLENQAQVTVLYMTDGRGASAENGELIDIRRKEAESLGEKYNINQIFWTHKDTCLTNSSDTVAAMIELLEELQPTLVYLPTFFDHHFDHFAANQILVDALKRLSPAEMTIAGYEVWDSTPFPNYIVDISSHFEKKAEILSHYATPLKATDFTKLCRYRNSVHYTLYIDSVRSAVEGYAEAFSRFDSATYQMLYDQYLNLLQEHGSLLPSHVMNQTPKTKANAQ